MISLRIRGLLRRRWTWLPFAALLPTCLVLGFFGMLALDIRSGLLVAALFTAWWLGQGSWPTALVIFALMMPGLYDRLVLAPRAATGLAVHQRSAQDVAKAGALVRYGAALGGVALDGEDVSGGQLPFVRITGTVRRQTRSSGAQGKSMLLLLGEVAVEAGDERYALAEIAVELPVGRLWYRFHGRKVIRIGGRLVSARWLQGRLVLALTGAEYHFVDRPLEFPDYLRTALSDRAAYYLSKPALAVYQPILLGIRQQDSPEARRVVKTFRNTGAAHLFAISGLHVGLLYLIFMLVAHRLIGWSLYGPGLRYFREGLQLGVIAAIWVYLALIGFPVSAVRAALMGSLFAWAGLWGVRTPRIHILMVTAMVLLAIWPSRIYDISFQLSFLAYGCLLFALQPVEWRQAPPAAAWKR